MTNLAMAAQTIKDSISALDVGKAIGLDIDRHGRCPCPFHNGKDRNLKLFDGSRGYSCFVCHDGGDVIKFVRQYYSMSFKDAVAWFNDTFHLGLELERKMNPDEIRRAEIALQARKRAIEDREWKEKMQFDLALAADQIVQRLEEERDKNVPHTADEPWNDDFAGAIRVLPEARRFADDCMMNCTERKEDE